MSRFRVQVEGAIESKPDGIELVKSHGRGLWGVGELGWCQGLADGGAAKLQQE